MSAVAQFDRGGKGGWQETELMTDAQTEVKEVAAVSVCCALGWPLACWVSGAAAAEPLPGAVVGS